MKYTERTGWVEWRAKVHTEMSEQGRQMVEAPYWVTQLAEFQVAARAGDHTRVRALVARSGLHLLMHADTHELAGALDAAVRASPERCDAAFAFNLFLRATPSLQPSDQRVRRALAQQHRPVQLAYMFDLRLRGRVRDAHEFAQRALGDFSVIRHFADAHYGWPQFIAVQRGTTAMLSGDLAQALRHFEEARFRAPTPGLEMIVRDAFVKSALMHTTFGDPVTSRALLAQAAELPRTTSWAELGIDAATGIAESLLAADPLEAGTHLRRVDTAQLGELWPFYVHAEYRILDHSGAFAHAAHRLVELSELPFARVEGQGYPGSVIATASALNSIALGLPSEAKQHLGNADPDFVLTRVVRALHEMQIGAFAKAIAATVALREATLPLRRLDLWRLSILADAHLQQGETDLAIGALRETELHAEPLSLAEAEFFSQELRVLGDAHVARWPRATQPRDAYMDQLPRVDEHLTDREIEIVRALTSDRSRPELADELFISTNTLKTQLRSIYKKLRVASRQEALIEAARRGLL